MTYHSQTWPVLETKDAGDDDDQDIAAALADMTKAFETKNGELAEEVKAANERADELETKLARGLGNLKADDGPTDEQKAFNQFARKGQESLGPDQVKNLTTANNGGGYLAPPQFADEIIKGLVQFSPLRAYARVVSISGGEYVMPKRTGTMTATWVTETGNRQSTDATYDEAKLTPHEAACFVDVSNALLEDNAYKLEGELARDFAEEFGRLEGESFVDGDGTGKPLGLMQETGLTEVNSGTAAAVDKADALVDLFHALPGFYAANGVWMMNRSTIGTVRKLKDADGRYLWQDSLTDGNPPTILGRPVAEMPDMPDIAANAFPIAFGDMAQAYRIVDRIQLAIIRDPFTQATKGQTRFHARRRVGGGATKAEAVVKMKVAA